LARWQARSNAAVPAAVVRASRPHMASTLFHPAEVEPGARCPRDSRQDAGVTESRPRVALDSAPPSQANPGGMSHSNVAAPVWLYLRGKARRLRRPAQRGPPLCPSRSSWFYPFPRPSETGSGDPHVSFVVRRDSPFTTKSTKNTKVREGTDFWTVMGGLTRRQEATCTAESVNASCGPFVVVGLDVDACKKEA